MRTQKLFITTLLLTLTTYAVAQFSNTYQVGSSRNNSGFVIENFVDNSGVSGFITACASYNNGAIGSVTSGIRVTAVDNAGTVIFDRRYFNSNTEIRCFDIYRRAATNTYLITGYVRLGGLNRAFVFEINAAGTLLQRKYLPITVPSFSASYTHGISMIEYGGMGYAVTGFVSLLEPTAANEPVQQHKCFLALLDYNLNYVNTTLFEHTSTTVNNSGDVPLHITDVPSAGGLHITGSCQSNTTGRDEAVLNIMFDYTGALMWENSFMDLNTEDVEIGQFSHYDADYDLLYLLSYKYNSRTIGLYAIDPYSGIIISAMHYLDPNQIIYTLYGLTLTKDPAGTNIDDLYITGYIIGSSAFPQTGSFGYPVFTTSMYIPDLLSGTPNATTLYAYDIDMTQYGSFNFSANNNMLASDNTVLHIPTCLGFATQMAVASNDMIAIASPRLSYTFGRYHPTVSLHTTHFNDICYTYNQVMKYDNSYPSSVPPCVIQPVTYTTVNLPGALTSFAPSVYPCYSAFLQETGNTEAEDLYTGALVQTLGTEEENTGAFRFYPTIVNEAAATFYLDMPQSKDARLEVSIYDMSGRMVYQYQTNVTNGQQQITIKAENLSPGMNIVHINGTGKPIVQKVIRQ